LRVLDLLGFGGPTEEDRVDRLVVGHDLGVSGISAAQRAMVSRIRASRRAIEETDKNLAMGPRSGRAWVARRTRSSVP
jgi:hypothetical protein